MKENSYAFVGYEAERTVADYNADVVFFSCRGLSEDGVLTDRSIEENDLRRVMLSHAKKKVLLLDSGKIGKSYLNRLCSLSEIDELVEKKFGGSVPAFIAAFAKSKKLNEKEIEEIRRIIGE